MVKKFTQPDIGSMINLLTFGVVGLIGYKIYKNLMGNPTDGLIDDPNSTITNQKAKEIKENNKPSLVGSSDLVSYAKVINYNRRQKVKTHVITSLHEAAANALYHAMNKDGTDEQTIYKNLDRPATDLWLIVEAFSMRKKNDLDFILVQVNEFYGNLFDFLNDELNTSEKEKVNKILKKRGFAGFTL